MWTKIAFQASIFEKHMTDPYEQGDPCEHHRAAETERANPDALAHHITQPAPLMMDEWHLFEVLSRLPYTLYRLMKATEA